MVPSLSPELLLSHKLANARDQLQFGKDVGQACLPVYCGSLW